MAGKRKERDKTSTPAVAGSASAEPVRRPAPASPAAKQSSRRDVPWWEGSFPADPPRRHFGFLAASGLALAAWLAFLVAMALRG